MYRIILVLLLLLLTFSWERKQIAYELNPPEEAATFGVEDRNGRIAYEQMLLANPETGEVPENIKQRELLFAKHIRQKTNRARNLEWPIESAGPFNVGGRTRAVALDTRDENVVLAGGVSGGIWKSTDGGHTWTRKSDPENRNSVSCIVQDTRLGREDTWYHGTGELIGNSARGGNAPFRGNGIYKSTDNGETWNVIPSTEGAGHASFNSQFQYIWNIEINEQNLVQDELIVAAFGGILRSLDGGDTWQVEIGRPLFNLPNGINLNEVNVSFFSSLEKTSDGVYYAALSTFSTPDGHSPDGGIYVSEDRDNWSKITPFTSGSIYRRIVMGHAPSDPRRCYFLVDSSPTFILSFTLLRFTDSGPVGVWSEPLEVPMFGGELGDFNSQMSYNMVIKVDPAHSSTVFVGGRNLYRSTDGFTTAGNIKWIGGYEPGGGTGLYPNHHPDQHEILFYPSDPNKMLSANDGGIRVTQNFNADSVMWQSRNNGYLTSQFFTVALSQETDDLIIGGMQDNGTSLTSGGLNWRGIIGADGGYAETTTGKRIWYSSFQNGPTFRLTLNEEFEITSFARVDPKGLVLDAGSDYLFINPFVIDPVNPNRMFIAGGNYIYVNENVAQIPGGSQKASVLGWDRLDDTRLRGGVFSTLDISLDGKTVYAGSSNGLLFKIKSASDKVHRQVTDITARGGLPFGYVSCVSINPENTDHVLVVFSNYEIPSIFESLDGGITFQNISANLEENVDGSGNGPSVRWGEIIPLNSGTLYLVGTSTGLYSSEGPGADRTWAKEFAETIGSAVIPMMDYRPQDGRLAIATHGNGVFSTDISDFKPMETTTTEGPNFDIIAAFPNPFRNTTTIQYDIPEDGTVRIDLFSSKGELINNLLWGPQFAGTNSIAWNGTNASGTPVANGIYFYRIEYNGSFQTGKLSLRK